MTTKEKLELAHWVAEQSRKAGANDAAVALSFSRNVTVQSQNHQLDELKEATSNALSIDIYADGRYSSHSTCDLGRDALGKFVAEAVAMTKYLTPDPDRVITDPKYYQGRRDMDLKRFDPYYDKVTSQERVEIARECEEAAYKHDNRVVACTGYYGDSLTDFVRVHTNGFEGTGRYTDFGAYSLATVRGDGDQRPADWCEYDSCFFKPMTAPDVLAKEAVARAASNLGQSKMASGRYHMLVDNRAMSSLIGAMFAPLNGASLHRKNSFLDGKLGEKIGSDKFTVIDDPFIVSGLGSRWFDGDGISAQRRVIFDKGVLKNYYIGYYYSRKLKMEPTSGGSSNVVYEYGDKSLEEMIGGVDKGILVTSFVGGNSNDTTGDFSYGIIGQYLEGGRIVKPVNEMNISGNFMQLWSQLVEVGNDPYPYSSNRCPSMLFLDIDFAGL